MKTKDFGIQLRVTGRSPKWLILRFLMWLDFKLEGYSTVAYFLDAGQDIYLCPENKVWNADMLEINDYQFLYDIIEHETFHGVFNSLLYSGKNRIRRLIDWFVENGDKTYVQAQRWFDYIFNLETRQIVPRDIFDTVGLNTPQLPDSTGDD